MGKVEQSSDALISFVGVYGPKLIGAIITLVIDLGVVKKIGNFFDKTLKKRGIDPSLGPFLSIMVSA